MKSIFKIVIFFFVFVLLTSSCDPAKKFESELKTIDSCLVELNEIDSLFSGIEFDSLNLMIEHVNKNEELMKQYYSSDTINMELGSFMNSCKGIRKSMKNLETTKTDFSEEIAAINLQLNNLKTDILNDVLEKEQIKEYILSEKDALNKLNLSFTSFYENQVVQKGVYYYCVPLVDQYVNALNIPGEDSLK